MSQKFGVIDDPRGEVLCRHESKAVALLLVRRGSYERIAYRLIRRVQNACLLPVPMQAFSYIPEKMPPRELPGLKFIPALTAGRVIGTEVFAR